MKPFILIINISLMLGVVGCSRKSAENVTVDNLAKPASRMSIDDVIVGLLKAHPKLKVGMEVVPSVNNTAIVSDDASTTETQAEAVQRVSALIAKQTGYECRVYNHWLVVVPRPNKALFNQPGSLRVCTVPAAKGLAVYEFLGKIKGVRAEEPLMIGLEDIYIPNRPTGAIDSKERTAPCFQILCDTADQLSARCWRMEHAFETLKDSPDKILYPINLSWCDVEFHAPGAIRSTARHEN